MATGELALNPYRPVLVVDEPNWQTINYHAPLTVAVSKGLLYRRMQLSGMLEADVVWDARSLVESVRVNGRRVASEQAFWYVPRFEFEIPAGRQHVLASIDVQLSWAVMVKGFRLTVAGQVGYGEGCFRE